MPKGVYERKPGWGSWSRGRTDLGGPSDPRWKRVEKTCATCGVGFFVKQAHANLRKTCSRKCGDAYRSKHFSGENAHAWKGGISKRAKYRNTFKNGVRKEVKERDVVCQGCGSENDLQVHHKNFVRTESDADNLILLCASCHATVEKVHASMLKRGISSWNKIFALARVGIK